MKKIGIIAVIIVLIVGGVLVGVNYYENRVIRSIKEMMTQLPPSWKGEVDHVDYSLFGNNLVMNGFSLTINGSEGPYVIKADEVLVDSLDGSVFRSGVPGRLANSIVLKGHSITMPSGAEHSTEFLELKEVIGDFGHMADLIQNNAPAEVILPVVYKIRASRVAASNYTLKDESMEFDTTVFSDVQGKAVTALSARELIFNDIKMYRQGQLGCSFASMTTAMDMSALANSYVVGREMELYRGLFDPGVRASFSLLASKMEIKAEDDSAGATMESLSLGYANTENELTLQGKMESLIVPVPEDNRELNISFNLDYKATDNAVNPLKLDMEFKDMGNFSLVAEAQGRAAVSSKISRVEAIYSDAGLVNIMLESMAREQGISASAARQQIQAEIKHNLTDSSNQLVADLGRNLELMLDKPGSLTLTIVPEQPLSSQQFSMYLLLQPKALNYSFQLTTP